MVLSINTSMAIIYTRLRFVSDRVEFYGQVFLV